MYIADYWNHTDNEYSIKTTTGFLKREQEIRDPAVVKASDITNTDGGAERRGKHAQA